MINKFTELKYTKKMYDAHKTKIKIGEVTIGGESPVIMAGPCTISNREDLKNIAVEVKKANCQILRGGAFKPRTSPYTFQGLEEDGLRLISEISKEEGLLSISEIMEIKHIETAVKYVDIIQIGARNMQNFALLKQLGKINKPILLKRGLSATIYELLMAAEYIISEGNPNVILCERGIRTFENSMRNTLDLGAVALLKGVTHLPIIVDPSHGTGIREIVPSMCYSAVACGCDGLIIEADVYPDNAISDKEQTISTKSLQEISENINKLNLVIKGF